MDDVNSERGREEMCLPQWKDMIPLVGPLNYLSRTLIVSRKLEELAKNGERDRSEEEGRRLHFRCYLPSIISLSGFNALVYCPMLRGLYAAFESFLR